MSTKTDQLGLNQKIVQDIKMSQQIVDAFMVQLFTEIEKNLVVDSHIKVDGLGLFRVIKSGISHRILYLGNNKPTNITIDLSHLRNEVKAENKESLDEQISEVSPSEEIILDNNEPIINIRQDIISEADAVVIQNFHNSENKSRKITAPVVNRRKSNLIKTCIITLIILVILGISYFMLLGSSVKPEDKFEQNITFKELENIDTLNFSYIIIPESDVSLQYIAKLYYGNDVYWPYIYEANKNIINNVLIIQAGSITKIPKITVDLANLHNGKETSVAKSLGDNIYKTFR